jgi:hypothetical protein
MSFVAAVLAATTLYGFTIIIKHNFIVITKKIVINGHTGKDSYLIWLYFVARQISLWI